LLTNLTRHTQVPGTFYVNDALKELVFEELETYSTRGSQGGGFIPAVRPTSSLDLLALL
jgi:tRNA-splicing ligase RtcB